MESDATVLVDLLNFRLNETPYPQNNTHTKKNEKKNKRAKKKKQGQTKRNTTISSQETHTHTHKSTHTSSTSTTQDTKKQKDQKKRGIQITFRKIRITNLVGQEGATTIRSKTDRPHPNTNPSPSPSSIPRTHADEIVLLEEGAHLQLVLVGSHALLAAREVDGAQHQHRVLVGANLPAICDIKKEKHANERTQKKKDKISERFSLYST